jgi:hypothetical protein
MSLAAVENGCPGRPPRMDAIRDSILGLGGKVLKTNVDLCEPG